jgi:peptidoglycan hydrolase-like protein with peptidoglycan-binding domain
MLLKQGSKGSLVEEVQRLLNAAGAVPRLDEDGDYGPRTAGAVMAFQRTHRDDRNRALDVDGEVGDRTWWALHHASGAVQPPPLPDKGGSLGQRVARIALGEAARGVVEVGGDNRGTDVFMYQSATGLSGTGWPWCAAFVTWCYENAGLVLRNAAGFASVALMETWARNTRRWKPRVAGYVAPVGSIVVFKFSHTGIVISGEQGHDVTVEGNTCAGFRGSQRNGGGVYQRTRRHSIIKGYVVMDEIVQQ